MLTTFQDRADYSPRTGRWVYVIEGERFCLADAFDYLVSLGFDEDEARYYLAALALTSNLPRRGVA